MSFFTLKYDKQKLIRHPQKAPPSDENFKEFLTKFLRLGMINERDINKCLSDHLQLFKRAFIHSSFDPNTKNNYERLEFIGDAVLKPSIIQYITDVVGVDINNPAWLSGLKNMYEKHDALASFAYNYGFGPYISISLNLYNSITKEDTLPEDTLLELTSYYKIYEDVFEAILGATSEALNTINGIKISVPFMKNKITLPGVGKGICSIICYSFFSTIDVILPTKDNYLSSATYKNVFPSSSRFSEIFNSINKALGITNNADKIQPKKYFMEYESKGEKASERYHAIVYLPPHVIKLVNIVLSNIDNKYESWVVKYTMNTKHRPSTYKRDDFFTLNNGQRREGVLLGYASGRSKGIASRDAYENALQTLFNNNIIYPFKDPLKSIH